MSRTFGRYQYGSPRPERGEKRGTWVLEVEPQVAMRVKRMFGRVRQERTGLIGIGDSIEVRRDLEWLMERFPLAPVDQRSADLLTAGAAEHRQREEVITAILGGDRQVTTLPREPAKAPRDYQRTAVDLLRATGRLLLTDEVGLGKTFTGLLGLVHDDALPAVVVPPTHLPRRWLTELEESMPWLRVHVVKKTTPYPLTGKDGRDPDVIVVPYSKVHGWADHLRGHVKTIVFDEVQDLRTGPGTRKYDAAALLADSCPYRLGLTATPIYNYGGEVWNVLNVLAPGELGSRDEFIREWGAGAWNGNIKVANPGALGSYLREQGLMLGRTRKEVGRELPDTIKVQQFVEADPAALDRVAGDATELARLILAASGDRQEKWRAAGEIDWMVRQATGIGKAPYVAEFIRLLLESEEKVVLFGWHRAVYDLWLQRLAEFNPVLYTGSESPTQKAKAEDAFTNGNARVLVMSLRSGSGVDGLQKVCRTAVFGELDWSPQVHEQAIGRVRRDGMGDAPPVAYFLVSDQGSDPSIAQVLMAKRQQAEPMLSKDGKLFAAAQADTQRARTLAQAVLARQAPTRQSA